MVVGSKYLLTTDYCLLILRRSMLPSAVIARYLNELRLSHSARNRFIFIWGPIGPHLAVYLPLS